VVAARSEQCAQCGSPVAEDQRYCLQCGARIAARSPQLEAILRRVGGRSRAAVDLPPTVSEPGPPVDDPATASTGLSLPSPRISALLVLVFLGFGAIVGRTVEAPTSDSLASARAPLKLVLPASGSSLASASTGAHTTEASASETESEPPATEAEPTPAAAPTTSTHSNKPRTPAGSEGAASKKAGEASGSEGGSSESSEAQAAKTLPPVKHVFVVMLSDEPYASVFGPSSAAPYLSGTLEHKGELLVRYDAVAHEELADEIALLSGQGPTTETASNCPNYTEITGVSGGVEEQVLGSGCVYPSSTQTLLSELSAKGLTSRAYVQGIDEAGAQAGACPHPTLGQPDLTAEQSASTGLYATFRNPFVYFASVVDSPDCANEDVGLSALKVDLASAKSTPSFSYIAPDRCDDGNPTPCTPGAPAGLAPANAFLEQVVPEITGSKAYKESGLLVITVDEAPSSGELADSSSCCGESLFPNDPVKTVAGAPRGGGTVGALLLSPFVKGGTVSQEEFNHFSLLRTIEDLFALKHLGYAGASAVKSFEPSMFIARAKG
jgi:hypothetical protein